MDTKIRLRSARVSRNMKKILLTSAKLDLLPELISVEPAKSKLVFIPTAADPYDDKWFVEADRQILKELGFSPIELDLKRQTQEKLKAVLQGVDIIHVAGGNSFYLLQEMKESGFDKIVKDLVEKGVVYSGASAGAIVAGPDIESTKFLDDPSEAPRLKSSKGLNLVDFIVLPHYEKEKCKEKYEKTMREFADKGLNLIPITDEEFIVVEDNNYRILK